MRPAQPHDLPTSSAQLSLPAPRRRSGCAPYATRRTVTTNRATSVRWLVPAQLQRVDHQVRLGQVQGLHQLRHGRGKVPSQLLRVAHPELACKVRVGSVLGLPHVQGSPAAAGASIVAWIEEELHGCDVLVPHSAVG